MVQYSTNMKTAFVHDWIVHLGWAELVLKDLITEYSNKQEAELCVFTLYSTHRFLEVWEKKIPIMTALPKRMNEIFGYFASHKVVFFSTLFDYRNLMFWFPLLCHLLRKKIEKRHPDFVVISSFAAVKNIVEPTKHITTKISKEINHDRETTLYLHSPMQYIRENYEDNIKKLHVPIKQLYQFASKYLRPRDSLERHYDAVLCNSNYTAELAKKIYNISGQVQYPKIENTFMETQVAIEPKNYFVFVGRVQRYVREIDKVIELCNALELPLIILWDWPDMEFAKSIAWKTIIFVGHIADTTEKIKIIKHARGLINLAKESFGIATMEALSLGVPVFGYDAWGTHELVKESSWILCKNKDIDELITKMKEFLQKDFDRKEISKKTRELLLWGN